jgi:CRP/FNR family transcriptional regulator, cyclic AMP receptor protein
MAERTQAKTTSPRDLLLRNPLFAQLGSGELDRLAALFRRRRYRAGEPVFREGDPGTALYIIDSGEVKILLGGSEGKEVVLSLLPPGEFFGELALLDGEPRSADAVTTVATELLILPRDEFLRFLRDVPPVAINMLAALSRRLRRTDRLVHDAAFSDVQTRMARVLLELGATRGTPEGKAVAIEPHLTQGDLANMVGATRESVNKCLRALAADGLVRHERGRLVLLDVDRLRRQLA